MKKILFSILLITLGATIALVIKNYLIKKNKTPADCSAYNTPYFNNGKRMMKVRMLNAPPGICKPIMTFHRILEEKYNIRYVADDSYDLVINQKFGTEEINNKKAIKIFYTAEAITPDISKYDLSIGFDHINDPKYIRVPYVYMDYWNYFFHDININYDREAKQGECKPQKPNFACFLVSNPKNGNIAAIRINIFQALSKYKAVLSGGKSLNNIGYVVPREETLEWMNQCKFVIAYENNIHDGYITEKLFQAYFAGSIPIYYAHKNVLNDINRDAVIFAPDFATEEDLIEYIKRVDQDDELYCKIWNQNIIKNPDMNYDAVYERLKKKIHEVLDAKLKLN